MAKTFHILNGDALKERFLEKFTGEQIVMRECLVDGDVSGDSLETFFSNRSAYLSKTYGDVEEDDYRRKSITEINKIIEIPDGSAIYLWFEDDLFCQVNFWFTCWLIKEKRKSIFFLVRPVIHNMYGFGGLSDIDLFFSLDNQTKLTQIDLLSDLWIHYKNNDLEQLLETAKKFPEFPFIQVAVEAHIERFPKEGLGRPEKSLMAIMEELGADKFGPVFQEFCKRESVYGFGDLQVKKIYDQLLQRG